MLIKVEGQEYFWRVKLPAQEESQLVTLLQRESVPTPFMSGGSEYNWSPGKNTVSFSAAWQKIAKSLSPQEKLPTPGTQESHKL